MTAKIRTWFKTHSLRVLALRDTPNAIAGGVAIGFFLGFTPFFGLKSWMAIAVAWLTRCNIIAALTGSLPTLAVFPAMRNAVRRDRTGPVHPAMNGPSAPLE